MGSGNLGLVYLMEERRRLTLEEMNERHPDLIPALRNHPHVGWLLVRSSEHGPVVLGGAGTRYLADGRVEGEDPLAAFSPNAPQHLLRTDGFTHVADIMIGSFYDPALETGCAFEELISFHGGIGGPQTRPFILHPTSSRCPTARSSARPPCTRSCSAGGASSTAPPRRRKAGHRALRPTSRVTHATVHVLVYALAAAASPLVLTATFVVIRSDRPRTNGIAFLSGFLLGTIARLRSSA